MPSIAIAKPQKHGRAHYMRRAAVWAWCSVRAIGEPWGRRHQLGQVNYTAAGLSMTRTHANIDDGTPGGSVR